MTGNLGDMFTNARFIDVQTYNKRTHDQNAVLLDTPYGGAKVPVFQKIEFLAKFLEPFLNG